MSFQPVLPASGLAGWRFLQRTAAAQEDRFAASPLVARETAAFRERIANVRTAEALVADRTLLKVALGAFGLEADLGNRAFLRRVFESSPGDGTGLANRLADKRYLELSRSFGFSQPGGPNTTRPGFADRIVAAYERRGFEAAVGEKDGNLRLALAAGRELEALAARRLSADTAWLTVLGQPPLRRVFEVALGLPPALGRLDLDRQIDSLRDRARAALGNGEIAQFADPSNREALNRLFLLRADGQTSSQAARLGAALTLLGAAGRVRP